MASRSRFYVDTPRDPSQRHSMFVSHSELAQKQDLSSNSSSATLPCAAGSVDRLTGLDEKKSPRFFTLKPKTSFSLRPFFRSSSSLASLSPSKRKKTILERRDSYVQTEESRPVLGEVGVQTLNASTVDVPVQTCLEAWEEGDSYGLRKPAYTSARISPFWNRPSVASSALSNSLIPKNVAKDPLVSPKLIKYATPGDSQKTALHHLSAVAPFDVNNSQSASASLSHSSSPCSESVPVKYFSAKELTSNVISLSDHPHCQPINKIQKISSNDQQTSNSVSSDPEIKDRGKTLCESETSLEYNNLDNQTLEVSNELKYCVPQNVEHSISALKTERTDSPSKRFRTVHFDLSNSESFKPLTKNSVKLNNVDEDFDALLKDLNILTDDVDESDLKISFNSVSQDKYPTTRVLSPAFKSALDALKVDFLAPIPENSNEFKDSELTLNLTVCDTPDKISGIINETEVVNSNFDESNELPTSSISEFKCQNKTEKIINDSETPTSLDIFTSANSNSNPETDSLEGNVYDNVIIEENPVKIVPLPTLPSFFEPPTKLHTSESTEITESVKTNKSDLSTDTQAVSTMPLQTDTDRSRLSRSSSRNSIKSNSKPGVDTFSDPMNRFDSCENLDQLEEEIIRSLYSPDEEKLEESIMKNIELPPSESFQNSGTAATHMRRVILDQLLSGKSVEDIVPNYSLYQRIHSVPETENKFKSPKKYTAILTKFNGSNYEIPSAEQSTSQNVNSQNSLDFFSNTGSNNQKESGNMPDIKYSNMGKTDSPKKTSIFLFPEDICSESGTTEKSIFEISTIDQPNKGPSILEVRRSSWTPQITDATASNTSSISSVSNENSTSVNEEASNDKTAKCDFTNCLRPSKIQNSPFLAKINTRSMSPCNFNPTFSSQNSSQTYNNSIVKKNDSPPKLPEAVGECDYASCLKPSQVQNTSFTAELSEITANKSTNSLRAGSPITIRTSSPFSVQSNCLDPPSNSSVTTEEKNLCQNIFEPVKHKSEFLLTLQTNTKHSDNIDNKLENPSVLDSISPEMPSSNQNSDKLDTVGETKALDAVIPPPPPPPPPTSYVPKPVMTKDSTKNGITMESMIQQQKSNLTAVEGRQEIPDNSKNMIPKTPVMVELETRLQSQSKNDSQRRNSDDKVNDQSSTTPSSDHEEISNIKRCEINLNGSSNSISNGSHQNGSIGILSGQREHNTSISNGKCQDNHSHGTTKLTFSPNTVITDEPPPLGAVLLDKKITVDGDNIHTDKFYAIPVKEVLKEKTSTTKFIPAPPKYEGIGPTEDGIPIGLRNSVKKENMHNWYKTMFKSLHKADSSNDSQEYIIGYTSEPETSKRDMMVRKKSSTLDNRIKHDVNSSLKQSYPPSAKSSIEVYNVRPRLIEDYEPGYSSVTDDNITISRRHLPTMNTPKPSYEFKNGYESDSTIIRKKEQPEPFTPEQQKIWYREVQKGGDIPQFGLGKLAPEKPKEPCIGPIPPPPLNYNGHSHQQAVRPLTLPTDYSNQNGNAYSQQMNGAYEMQMRHAIHSEMQQRMSPSSNQLSPPNRIVMKSPCRSPDMKVLAQALFDFKAESPKEIPLKKGDTVLILRQLDKNWYEGEHKGVVGIFPISYVEIVPPEHASVPVKAKTEGLGRALYDFVAQTSVELTVRKGDTIVLLRQVDANWFEGIFNNKKGIIPISYVQILQEPMERNMGSPLQKSCAVSPNGSESREKMQKVNSISPSTYSSGSTSPLPVNQGRRKLQNKKGSSLIEPVLYRAMYSYNPQNSDELELEEGDSVYVVEMCDDGWYVGTSVRTGIFGIFPGNYVEKIC